MTLNCFSDKLNKQKLFAETLLKEFFSKKETFYLHGFTIKIKQTSDLIFLLRESWKKSSGRKKSHSSTQRIILHWFTQQQNKVVKSRQTNLRNKEMCWDCWRMLEVESDKELLSCNTIVAREATLYIYTISTQYLHTTYTLSTHSQVMRSTLLEAGLSLSLVNIEERLPLSLVKSALTGRYWNKKNN